MTARVSCAVIAGLVFCGIVRAADTLEDVQKKIIAQAEKIKTWSAEMTVNAVTDGPDMRSKSKVTGTTESAKRGDKTLSRRECKVTGTTKMGDGAEMKNDSTILTINDGEFAYTLTESDGQKSVLKTKPDPSKSDEVSKAMFDQMKKEYNLKLLPDEKVDGKEAYVIEATPKKPQPDTATVAKFYYLKDSGIMTKSVSEIKDKNQKAVMTAEFTDIKLNPDIKPDRFVFKAPEGVQVMDLTKVGQPQPDESEKPADTTAKDQKETNKDQKETKSEPQTTPKAQEPAKSKKPGLPLPKLKNPLK